MKTAILALFAALPMVGQTVKATNICPSVFHKTGTDKPTGGPECKPNSPPVIKLRGGVHICPGCGDGDFIYDSYYKDCNKQPETGNGGEGCNPEGKESAKQKKPENDLKPPAGYKEGIPQINPEFWKDWTELHRTPEYMVPYSYAFDNDGIEMDQTPLLIGSSGKTPDILGVYVRGNALASKMETWSGEVAVMLADSEYSKLQQLRQAVVDEEKRLAVKYGAQMSDLYIGTALGTTEILSKADHYEFHSQFLLIEKGSK